MLVGFFMTLIDWTAVSVANPSIMAAFHADYESVIWVTSAYLLGFAVPLLVAGRLGDRFGPKNVYLVGLAVFTAGSLWCGLSGSIDVLIAARVVQGLGAALLTPQTLLMITRIFPAERRGVATSIWGAAVGVATLAGPLVGGVLIDQLDWQWIFFVNVPIGVISFGLAVWLMPVLPTSRHRFDVIGVVLSGIALFLIVFALQEARFNDWAPWIWAMFAAGLAMSAPRRLQHIAQNPRYAGISNSASDQNGCCAGQLTLRRAREGEFPASRRYESSAIPAPRIPAALSEIGPYPESGEPWSTSTYPLCSVPSGTAK